MGSRRDVLRYASQNESSLPVGGKIGVIPLSGDNGAKSDFQNDRVKRARGFAEGGCLVSIADVYRLPMDRDYPVHIHCTGKNVLHRNPVATERGCRKVRTAGRTGRDVAKFLRCPIEQARTRRRGIEFYRCTAASCERGECPYNLLCNFFECLF